VIVASPTPDVIARAAQILRGGGLVAFPTETVYGLGADATEDAAVRRIYAAKGRPAHNPLIVHVHDRTWVEGIAIPDGRLDRLARTFWPGPLTVVMRRRPDCPISPLVSAGDETIALRAPDHAVARDILAATRRPLAAPSANRSGTVSPTTAAHVASGLGDEIDLIVDGGPCRVGIESTVLDLTAHAPAILRPGAVTRAALEAVLGPVTAGVDDPESLRSPGQLAHHYAPTLPVRMNVAIPATGEAMLGFGPIAGDLNLSAAGNMNEAAANLFAMMRALDRPEKYAAIAVAPVPNDGVGIAINDRLRRASTQDR
jgi:L-threonylcarbamoyladenylate synthase